MLQLTCEINGENVILQEKLPVRKKLELPSNLKF